MATDSKLENLLDELDSWYPNQPEYRQAVEEIATDVLPVFNVHPAYKKYDILRRLCLPERIIHFTVPWTDDNGQVQIERAWRVQHNGMIGPYKGGLRFHPTVNESVLKFLAFEQTFKNALTGLPMGGAKGGSDFNPKGRSENEIMHFCKAFMTELQRHIGPTVDVPAGDINVGSREIGFMYGAYRKINNKFGGVLTGKGTSFGGSNVRTEATGFGLVYMMVEVLQEHNASLEGNRIGISGAGNVALHAALKSVQLGGKVITLSNSRGVLINEKGFSEPDIRFAIENKPEEQNILLALESRGAGEWYNDALPWSQPMDIALPCATQNEMNESAAKQLVSNGLKYVLEGANMPCTQNAKKHFSDNGIPFVPGKAANAGGVALSGMEMTQNASFESLSFEKLDSALKDVMSKIHHQCVEEGKSSDTINYSRGANIAAFRRLADAMVAQGV